MNLRNLTVPGLLIRVRPPLHPEEFHKKTLTSLFDQFEIQNLLQTAVAFWFLHFGKSVIQVFYTNLPGGGGGGRTLIQTPGTAKIF